MTTFTVDLTQISCGKCGGTYAINERYRRQREEEGGSWNCPYCKCSWGYVTTTIDKLRRQLERSRSAIKGHLTRTKNRVKNGVCPCCKRSFENLRQHMETKHPEYAS